MALFITFGRCAASTAYFNWELFTSGVPNKLAGLLLNVASAAGGLIHCPALFWALPVALLDYGPVALFHHTLGKFLVFAPV